MQGFICMQGGHECINLPSQRYNYFGFVKVQSDQHSLLSVLRGTLQLALETLEIKWLLMLFNNVCIHIYIYFFFRT